MTKAKTKGLLKFEIRNRWTGDVQFVAEIEADESAPFGVKVGLAVKLAIGSSANLSGANLRSANLRSANLSGANLSGAKNADLIIVRTRILPEGDLIGWKKCRNAVIVKLRIPEAHC